MRSDASATLSSRRLNLPIPQARPPYSSAALTSSSFSGLMIASSLFIPATPYAPPLAVSVLGMD